LKKRGGRNGRMKNTTAYDNEDRSPNREGRKNQAKRRDGSQVIYEARREDGLPEILSC